jgi:cellobiose phosphorylase
MAKNDSSQRWILPSGDDPLRGEILSAERLAEAARGLAGSQEWTSAGSLRATPLLPLLERAEESLTAVYGSLASAVRKQIPVSVSAEWLLDNFYLIEEQIRTVRDDLPEDYGSELPRLLKGELRDYPRIFEAVALLVTATDARLDREHLERFVMAFQDVSPLTIGEVWAVPIMLRVCLVENLRRVSLRVRAAHDASVSADMWANRILAAAQAPGSDVGSVVDQLSRAKMDANPGFLIRLSQRLQDQDPNIEPAIAWLESTVRGLSDSFEQLTFADHQSQATDQVSVANAITSIRFLGALEWREFFEDCSLVEAILREDPSGVYGRMDFVSRDRYRHSIEKIAERCAHSEIAVAEAVLSHSLDALRRNAADPIGGHVGHYLISAGRYRLERSLSYRPRIRELAYRGPLARKGLIFWGLLGILTALLSLGMAAYVVSRGVGVWWTAALIILSIIPLSDLAVNVVNRVSSTLWPARILPKLDFLQPVSAAHRTMVVIPALLTSPGGTQAIIDNLELAYLANRDDNVLYGLLGDLKGGSEEHQPNDAAVIDAARHGIATLNATYGNGTTGPFHLFVRGRRFNTADEVWMGWERKRGALHEFSQLLRGTPETSFSTVDGDTSVLPTVTFVITLDSDTVLPRDAARKLISTIAHPLNRAQLDESRRRVVRGYGLVQPRVGMSLEGAERSPFAWLYSGMTGVDPYAGAVSDTYQDVFGEGSFTGKGIFEVDVMNAVLEDRFPENTLLSHDLLEGNFLRTALASDIEVLDDQPASYSSHVARLHRWVRGDWQTLPWLGFTVPTAKGRERNPLSLLHRWKIIDNLRRSLLAPTMMLFAGAGWVALPGLDWVWLTAMLAIVFFPIYFSIADSLLFRPRGADVRGDTHSIMSDFWRDSARALLSLTVLPHQAFVMLDAMCRALWRMTVSHRNMLEWETAAESERRLGSSSAGFLKRMWSGEAVLVAITLPAAVADPISLISAAPLLVLWTAAPFIAWRVSMLTPHEPPVLTASDTATMRRIARKTWRFFETFVTAKDHWLAPDNYQEDPKDAVAHRTSPTNIGLQLIAALTAYDLGYVSVRGLIDRTTQTLTTMAGMERYRGHFYNWYDTTTLQPLRPNYVSTVDSGNLAGHLLVLRVGLIELAERPLLDAQLLDGMADTVLLAIEELLEQREVIGPIEMVTELRTSLEELRRRIQLDRPPADLGEWRSLLLGLGAVTETLPSRAAALRGSSVSLDRVRSAIDEVRNCFHEHLADIESFAPWAHLLRIVPEAFTTGDRAEALLPVTRNVPSLVGLAEGLDVVLACLDDTTGLDDATAAWATRLADGIRSRRGTARQLLAELRLSAEMAREMWENADFKMLFDSSRMVFSIGFNTAEGRLDNSFYDMLASECRLASYLAIAKGDVPQEHWFRLGRSLTQTEGGRALVSWSASMFEYLMPLLVMRDFPGTLLHQTYRNVVKRQIQYGKQRGVPWGVSESAFNAKDVELTYQYQAFGVPGLGLKRGLSDDIVIAPYATVLALPIAPRAALDNLDLLSTQGAEGRYGYFEAVDYTPGRVPAGRERALVKAYMAHHQGMSLVAIGNMLTQDRMQQRFHADPVVRSSELLLQERVPRRTQLAQPHVEEVKFVRSVREIAAPVHRSYPLADTTIPATHFLSNGSYSVMATNAGGGYSRWQDHTITRYREDVTRDCWGTFFYLKDVESGHVWSAAYQPTCTEPDEYHVTFSADKAEYRRMDDGIETHTEVVVSPEDDVEVRRITVTNRRRHPLHLEVTSYLEVTLAKGESDHAHKAFSNLFVETEVIDAHRALLFSRRPRSAHEDRPWGLHVLACELGDACNWSYETNREAFLGRLHTPGDARAIWGDGRLTGSVGAVLDPICAIRQTLTVGPGESARLAFTTGAAETRQDAVSLAERYGDIRAAQRALDLAWSTSQIELRDLGITPEEAVVFQRLASRLLLTDPRSRLKILTKVENRLPMSGLWSIGISGDLPILLVKIEHLEETPLVRQALLAHQYWRSRGFECDLVILNTKPSAYASELDGRLRMLLRTGHALQLQDRPGGVHLRVADQVSPEVRNLLDSVARAVLTGDGGPIGLHLNLRAVHESEPDQLVPVSAAIHDPLPIFVRPELVHDNGYGGFDPETGEYVIVLDGDAATPAPWANVLANPTFGALVSEAGIGCTWAENSHENRITTWNNDPVSDGSGEAFYVRDEDTGEFWSPTLLPIRDEAPHVVRHGRGYTRFEHSCHGVSHTLDWFVAADAPVRIVRVQLENLTKRTRHLSVTHFIEWALGDSRSKAQQQVVTWWDASERMLMAHNYFNFDFPGRPAFLASDCDVDSCTASRTEFLGRNGDPRDPAAMHRHALGGSNGRFLDNCGAIMRKLTLEPGQSAEISFFLGQTESVEEAHTLIRRLREDGAVEAELAEVRSRWERTLGSVQATTPDAEFDRMVNGAVLYEALACRFWGRTATYQSSGAFGFRDQLQDCLALIYARPDLVREHIIEAARHQFPEGDVLHWWQPISGRGVRTRFTDDRLWLPFVTAEYIHATGDMTVLDVEVPYIEGPAVPEDREDLYLQVQPSVQVGSVYEHCMAAIEVSRPVGQHDLPLMGGGDWNDGMNRVGIGGTGESVWMAWFLDVVLRAFAPIAEARDESDIAATLRERADTLVAAIEREAWDGAWYRRAFFDDGTPLGTSHAEECRIDAIAQAWAMISGRGDAKRARRALESVEEKLVRWDDGLIALLTPPFNRMEHDPGYIKGYVPGVRENGGQYTHAAIWVALAYALLGDGDEAVALLDLINPVNHALDQEAAERYRVEPYVIAADVYAVEPHVGRGGWTWYTGSASWYYRVCVQNILGLNLEAENGERYLRIDPCVPKGWTEWTTVFRDEEATYEISVENPRGVNRGVERVIVDGAEREDMRIPLGGEPGVHAVRVVMLGG